MTGVCGYEFHELFHNLWPLAPDEYQALESHILRTGEILDPVIIWKGTKFVVDGHNRLTIADKHGLPFKTKEIAFEDEQHVIAWMREHQTARRNLSADLRLYNMGQVHKYWSEKAAAEGQSHVEAAPTKKTAEAFDVSQSTVLRAVKHAEAVESLAPSVKQKYIEGAIQVSVPDVAKLAAETKPHQAQAVKLVEQGRAKSISHALKQISPDAAEPAKDNSPEAAKASAKKLKVTFEDVELQRSFDALKRMISFMPMKIYRAVRPQCDAILKEMLKHQET